MNEGRLYENSGEFFIAKNDNCAKGEEWSKMFQIFMDFIPLFTSYDMAFKIFITGKSINFIKQEGELTITNETEPLDISATLDTMTDRRLANWVNSA